MKSVKFINGSLEMAGNLYFPEGFDASRKYAAIVCVHPGGGVKEQTAGRYAEQLAREGFVTLAFDASCQERAAGRRGFSRIPMRASTTCAARSIFWRRKTSSIATESGRSGYAQAAAMRSTRR